MKSVLNFMAETDILAESSGIKDLEYLIQAYNPSTVGSRSDFVKVAMKSLGVTKGAAERYWTTNKELIKPNEDYKPGMFVTVDYGRQLDKFNKEGGTRPHAPAWSGTVIRNPGSSGQQVSVASKTPKPKRSDMFNNTNELSKDGVLVLLQAFNPAIRGAKAEFVRHAVMYGRTEKFAETFWKENSKDVKPNTDYKLGMDVTIDYAIDVAHYTKVGGPRPTKPTRPDTHVNTPVQTPSVAGVTSSDKQKAGIIRYQARREDENATYTITYNPEKNLVIAKNDLGVQISLGNFHKDRRLGTDGTTKAIRAAVIAGLDELNKESLSLYKWKRV